MELIKNKLRELAEYHDASCISIYIPTHRKGMETQAGNKDSLELKNQLKDVKQKLEARGMSEVESEGLLKPVKELVNDSSFWRHQSDGLALFMADGFFRKYTVPVHFEAFNYISSEFYIKPLLPLFNDDSRFFLLSLQVDNIKFYEGSKYSITDVKIKDVVPSQLEEVVGYDYEDHNVQFRTQQGNRGQGMYHGHGDNETDDEIMRYFRSVDKGLMEFLHDDQLPPLVVACQDAHFAMFKEVNSYQNLYPQHISGNPSDSDVLLLHEKACKLLEPYFNKNRNGKLKAFLENSGSEKTSIDIREIIPAAINGKVDSLFLQNKSDLFGTYNPVNQKVDISNKEQLPNVSLLNLAATHVYLNGGNVYLLEQEDMPAGFNEANALYRY